MGWLKTLFKGSVSVDKVFTSVTTGIDKLSFTKQERAEFDVKMADAMAQFAKDTLSENTVRSKTRRFIAIFMIINIMVLFWLCVFLTFRGVDIQPILDLAAVFQLGIVFLTIIGFFFGTYLMARYQQEKKGK